MAQERSLTPGRRPVPKTYRVPEDIYAATTALADMFHGGVFSRVGEDAVCEYLTELGLLPASSKAGIMPRPETVTTEEASRASLEDIRELLEAMHGRIRSSTTAHFVLRSTTNKQLRAAFAKWPNVPEFVYPRIKRYEYDSTTPTKLFVHQRTQIALNELSEHLKLQIPNISLAKCIHISIRHKCKAVGVDPLELWRDRKPFTRPAFTRLPHPDTTYDTRSLEERAMAVTLALKVLADATLAHGFDLAVLPPGVSSAAERLFAALETTPLEE
jgi:hypothetical protein